MIHTIIVFYLLIGILCFLFNKRFNALCSDRCSIGEKHNFCLILCWPKFVGCFLKILKDERIFCKFLEKMWFLFKV